MRHVFDTMGTTVSLELELEHEVGVASASLLSTVESVFAEYDGRFSLYRPDSELSLVADGTLRLADASSALKDAYALALEWRSATAGAFTPHRPDGLVDLNGVVKALAIRAAGSLLGTADANWWISAGGDAQWSGTARHDAPWPIGIADPFDRRRLLCAISPAHTRSAVATSGRAERGDHIWRTVSSDDAIVQATVVASDIVTADVLATAIIAGGHDTLQYVLERYDVDALAVDRDGALQASPGFRRMLGLTASL